MSGPGSHPGVVIVNLSTDKNAVLQALETALGDGYKFLFTYNPGKGEQAVFASEYPEQP